MPPRLPYHLALSALFAIGSGCALTDIQVRPTYAAMTQRCVQGDPPLILDKLGDRRPQRHRVGIKKNGYGWETASVYMGSADEPMRWLRAALASELTAAGFRVLKRPLEPTEGLALTVLVEQFYAEPQMSISRARMVGQTLIEGRLRMPGNRWMARRIKGQTVDSGIFVIPTVGTYEALLLTSANKALGKLVAGVCELVTGQS